MKSVPFRYHAPNSIAEAIDLLSADRDAKILAGGQSLVPLMAMRLSHPSVLVDLNGIGELKGYSISDDGSLVVGAMTTQYALERDDNVGRYHPLATATIPNIAHEIIRRRGTVGGSLAHADPAAEWPCLALVVEATITCVGPSGRRDVEAEEFFLSWFTTALEPDEIIESITLSKLEGYGVGVYEVTRRKGDFALVGGMAAVILTGSMISSCRLGLIGAGDVPLRLGSVEQALTGRDMGAIAHVLQETMPPVSAYLPDVHASAEFKAHLAGVAIRRALEGAVADYQRQVLEGVAK